MRSLQDVVPTPEQLKIISRVRPGAVLIRGAAGSGKTSTAILRLRALTAAFVNRQKRQDEAIPVKILILTYNSTLRGYIYDLASTQELSSETYEIEISTFAKWAMRRLGILRIHPEEILGGYIRKYCLAHDLDISFVQSEVEYVLGRFEPDRITEYLDCERTGRGISPRMEKERRQLLLDEVICPHQAEKTKSGLKDWNDLAVDMIAADPDIRYDIVIADETQDFSANQIRAILNWRSDIHSLTFVLDAAQRIYPRGFTWREAGVAIQSENSHRLVTNYRNTVEIARFALPLVTGIPLDDDGTIPDFNSCERNGPNPIVIKGKFSAQTDFVIQFISNNINLADESIAILHAKGGGAFDFIKHQFRKSDLPFISLTRREEWPQGSENIAFSTLHSAKGLEFDYVFILGLNEEFTPHGDGDGDDQLVALRRLLAMGISRARTNVIVGYKPGEESILVGFFVANTFDEVVL